MNELHVFLLSKFCVQHDENIVNIDGRKTQELLSYLLLNRERPYQRETLAAMFWCDVPVTQAKGYLRKALWQLQTALEPYHSGESKDLLLVEQDWIQLNPEAHYWLDVTIFEQAFELVRGVPGREMQASTAQRLHYAIELYRGDLLEGCYHEWCLVERERFQQMYLIMLDKLMDYCEVYEEYETGLVYGMKILRYDQARERTHRHLMRLYYLAGNRTGALRQYERCTAVLEKELGVHPATTTVTLYEKIRDDLPITHAQFPKSNHGTTVDTAISLVETMEQIKKLQIELNHTQHQLEEQIATVEMLLHDQRLPPAPSLSA